MSAELPKIDALLLQLLGDELDSSNEAFLRFGRKVWQEAARQAMEQFERQVSEWMHVPTLKLRAGEMTAQEVRTVIGVLGAIRALIPQDPDHLAGVGNMVDGKDQSEERHG